MMFVVAAPFTASPTGCPARGRSRPLTIPSKLLKPAIMMMVASAAGMLSLSMSQSRPRERFLKWIGSNSERCCQPYQSMIAEADPRGGERREAGARCAHGGDAQVSEEEDRSRRGR